MGSVVDLVPVSDKRLQQTMGHGIAVGIEFDERKAREFGEALREVVFQIFGFRDFEDFAEQRSGNGSRGEIGHDAQDILRQGRGEIPTHLKSLGDIGFVAAGQFVVQVLGEVTEHRDLSAFV